MNGNDLLNLKTTLGSKKAICLGLIHTAMILVITIFLTIYLYFKANTAFESYLLIALGISLLDLAIDKIGCEIKRLNAINEIDNYHAIIEQQQK